MMLRRRMMGQQGGGGLPYDARVAYLKSVEDTVQYIDTGITPTSGHIYDFDLAYMSFSTDRKIIVGNYYSNCYNSTSIEIYTNNQLRLYESSNRLNVFDQKSSSLSQDTKIFVTANLDLTSNKTFTADYSYGSTQGSVGSGTTASSVATNDTTLKMFNDNRGGSNIATNHSVAIYYLKIYDNDVLVRDFIPVRVGQVGYMYDKVSGQLYGNSGTGNFVLGPDADSYIQDGLVFQLDGIDWGGIEGHWIERKNGYDWYEYQGRDAHLRDDGMVFDATYAPQAAFLCDSSLSYPRSTSSIEICARFTAQTGWGGLLNLKTGNVAFWRRTGSSYGWNAAFGSSNYESAPFATGICTVYSYNGSYMRNGVDITGTTTNSRNSNSAPVIGALDYINKTMSQYRFKGSIHSIRIYNRALTSEEIAHNYSIDRQRFNF